MSAKKFLTDNKLAQDMIILIAGLQDAGMYKEAESLSAKYSLFKEAKSEFLNVIDEESRKILEFAHEGDCEIIPTKSDLGKIHTDTSRQLKILETLNHEPTGKQVVAMVEEALGFKKKAQEKDELEEEDFSLSQKYKNINNLISSYNENVLPYNESLKTIKLEIPSLFKTSEAIVASKNILLPYYIQKSGIDKKTIENFNKKIKYIGLDIALYKDESISIINEYILKFAASNSKESFATLSRAISELTPNAAKEYFYGTKNDGSVDLGWFKGEVASLLTSAQWLQKLNEYKRNNNLFNLNPSSIFDGKIFAVKPSRWLEILIPGSGMGFRGSFSTPEEDAKLRQEAYSKITLDIELSLNSENVFAASNAIYQELLSERDSLFDKKDDISKFLLEKTSELKELNKIEKISSTADVSTVLSYITIANDNNQANYSLISSDDIKAFIDYTSLFLVQYNNIKPIIDKLLEIAYEVDPALKGFLSIKGTAITNLETILRHWKGVYESLEEGSKLSNTVREYYNNIFEVYKNLKNSNSINQLSSLTSGMPKAFRISSEEDIESLTNNLHADMEIFAESQKSDKPEVVKNKKATNLKSNLLTKMSSGGTGIFGGGQGKSENSQKGSVSGPSFNPAQVTELQKAINKVLGVTPDTTKSSDDQPKSSIDGILALKEDGVFGGKTRAALDALSKRYQLPPISSQTIKEITDKLNQVRSARPGQRYLIKFDNGEVYYNDLLSLQSFQKMLERLNPDKKEFTFNEWFLYIYRIMQEINKKTTIVTQGKQNINGKLADISLDLQTIAKSNNTTIEELRDTVLPAHIVSAFSKAAPNLGASSTSQKRPGKGSPIFGPQARGEDEDEESESQLHPIEQLNRLLPFDNKNIYLKNLAYLTNNEDFSLALGRSEIGLKLLSDDPEISAVSLFGNIKNYPVMKAYKESLESLKTLLSTAATTYIRMAMTMQLPEERIEAMRQYLDSNLAKFVRAINISLNRMNRIARSYR